MNSKLIINITELSISQCSAKQNFETNERFFCPQLQLYEMEEMFLCHVFLL